VTPLARRAQQAVAKGGINQALEERSAGVTGLLHVRTTTRICSETTRQPSRLALRAIPCRGRVRQEKIDGNHVYVRCDL
jgi:hypothetical protein